MKHESRFTPKEQEQLAAEQQQEQSSTAREFGSVEEMLRHDALHTPVPPTVAYRLRESIGSEAGPRLSWWRRMLGS